MTDLTETGLCLNILHGNWGLERSSWNSLKKEKISQAYLSSLVAKYSLAWHIKCAKKAKNASYPMLFNGTIKLLPCDKKKMCREKCNANLK